MGHHVALLRGINVGGHRRIPMAGLREAVTSAGFTEVRTYIQSGNVVFRQAPEGAADDPAASMRGVISARFGFDVEVVCRTRSELLHALDHHPHRAAESDLATLHVAFLDAAPDPGNAERLDPDRSPPDRFLLDGRELYLHYPEGSARSKLTGDYLERTLERTATLRNLKTIARLVQMATETDRDAATETR